MTYLFFDTETTGLPANMNAPVELLSNWPRIVQLAWALTDHTGELLRAESNIIQPEAFAIPIAAAKVHGITTYKAISEGIPIRKALSQFAAAIAQANALVCHNYDFDAPICGAEFIRSGFVNPIPYKPCHCTQKQSTEITKIPRRLGQRGYDRYKWPSLAELYHHCFGTGFADAHDALADVTATMRCFFHLHEYF